MDGDALLTIGDLARRTGTSVKVVRYYSDAGLVPPHSRSPAGHRRYGTEAVARLALVRTLRELGLDLASIRRVVRGEDVLHDVAAVHARALDAQIRTLRLRRAVLTAMARRGTSPERAELMHTLARLSARERRQVVDDFLDAVLGGSPRESCDRIVGSLTPVLPDEATDEQVEAWIEAAELSQDPDFRRAMRTLLDLHASERSGQTDGTWRSAFARTIRAQAAAALAQGVDPGSAQAEEFVAQATALFAGGPGSAENTREQRARDALLALNTLYDPRRDRYMRLVAVVNGRPAPPPVHPAIDWFRHALRGSMGGGGDAAGPVRVSSA